MNIFSIIGLLLAIVVVGLGMRLATDDLWMFLDYPSLFIVLGGTLVSAAISFQLNRLFVIFTIFFKRIIGHQETNFSQVIGEIMRVVEIYRRGGSDLSQVAEKTKDLFFKDALKMLAEGAMAEKRVLTILSKRVDQLMDQHMEEANKILVLAKFPPAFGMMGTVIGMVVLLSNLNGADAIKMVGPSMAVCLITTFYGLIVANVILIPVAENLMAASREVHLKNTIIVEGMKLLLAKENPVVVAEELNTFLPPGKRLDWKSALQRPS